MCTDGWLNGTKTSSLVIICNVAICWQILNRTYSRPADDELMNDLRRNEHSWWTTSMKCNSFFQSTTPTRNTNILTHPHTHTLTLTEIHSVTHVCAYVSVWQKRKEVTGRLSLQTMGGSCPWHNLQRPFVLNITALVLVYIGRHILIYWQINISVVWIYHAIISVYETWISKGSIASVNILTGQAKHHTKNARDIQLTHLA